MLSLELRKIEGSVKLHGATPNTLRTIKRVCFDEERGRPKRRRRRGKKSHGMVLQDLGDKQVLIIDYDENNHQLVVKLMDGESHELIKILSDDEARGILQSLGNVTGLIFDAYA